MHISYAALIKIEPVHFWVQLKWDLWSSSSGRPKMIRFLSSSSQCHLAVASRGCSKSITLLFPKECLLFSLLKWLRYSGNRWGRRGSRFHELAASIAACFPAWPNSPNSWGILYQSAETSSRWGRCRCQLARGHPWD